MSNAMSRSKSRWKAVLLATVATATVVPLAETAKADLSVGIYTNPLGGTSPNDYTGKSNVYIDPYATDTLYVYATVTGTSAPSPSYVDGLSYLYFNVNASTTNVTGLGAITAATPGSLFGGGNFNQTTTNPGAGAQGGAISGAAYTSTLSIAVGSNTSIGSIAKPRSPGNVYWNSSTGSGDGNVVVNGNSVSFLVEKLTYTPNTSAANANPSSMAAPNSVSFNVSIPTATITAAGPYVATNYFQGMSSTPDLGVQPSATQTSSFTASATTVKLTQTLPGDLNHDGAVDFGDFGIFSNFYGQTTGQTYSTGDLDGDHAVGFSDFGIFSNYYNQSFGVAPTGIAFPQALAAIEAANPAFAAALASSSVPEPASLSLGVLGAVGLLSRRRAKLG